MRAASETHTVVVNDEGQYAIVAAEMRLPAGWERVGEPAAREACIAVVKELWTDIRPRSARKASSDRK